jgi:hypothetical protein
MVSQSVLESEPIRASISDWYSISDELVQKEKSITTNASWAIN